VRRRRIPPWRHIHVNDLAELLLDGDEWAAGPRSTATWTPRAANLGEQVFEERLRDGSALLVLRRQQQAVQQGGGPLHGADVCRLPGDPRPRQRPLPGHDSHPDACWSGPAPDLALEQKAAANRQVIAVMRQRLAAGEEVARMYQEPGLAWLERQADVAEDW
jgi:hypothetical protein